MADLQGTLYVPARYSYNMASSTELELAREITMGFESTNMARRPRQTTKGTALENKIGAAKTTPLCLWSIREKGQQPCWNFDLQCPRPGTPGLVSTTLIRTRGFSPPIFFARWRKNARIRSSCARKMAKTDGANPSVASLDIWVCNIPFWEHQSSALWACSVPCGNTRPREHDASPKPRFLASGTPHSRAENRKKPPSLHPKKSPTPTVPTRR